MEVHFRAFTILQLMVLCFANLDIGILQFDHRLIRQFSISFGKVNAKVILQGRSLLSMMLSHISLFFCVTIFTSPELII